MDEDLQLLDAYARNGSEDAFRKLVERHSGMVHGVTRRIVGEDLAEEATQGTFLLLARKSHSLKKGTVLAGWLHRAARFVALETLRRENRKRELAEKLSSMEEPHTDDSIWLQLAPVLDEALDRLRAADREAIVLRFLEGRSFSEVAEATNSTEAAAKMRVTRALEKLRDNFSRQGLILSSAALASSLSANAVASAPAGIATAVFAKTAENITPTLVTLFKEFLFMKKIKMAVVTAGALLLTGSVVTPIALAPRAVVTTFQPMNGEWTGTMTLNANGNKSSSPVELSVNTSADGRRCDIDMRVAEDTFVQQFRFTHEIDSTGRKITTQDDPRISMVRGDGKVITGEQSASVWEAAVHSPHASGYTECRWIVRGDELKILRHDRVGRFLHKADQYSTLELRRKIKVAAAP